MTEAQLLLLNNIMYRPEFSATEHEGMTIREIFEEGVGNSKQQEMTPEEWDEIYKMVEGDPEILDLKLYSAKYEEDTGARMACFVDANGQAYAVFAGTGANEWRDDCVAGTMADSPQQEKALAWFESLPFDDIVVSGHSKGGNKAMYVTVVSDKAGECYAFDGEGFSNEFCEKYADQIKEKAPSIHLRSNSRDFVNILLHCIAGDVKFVNNNEGISHAGEYHCPNALFAYEDGKIVYKMGELTDYQDPAMEMMHDFTVYLLENATDAEKNLALSVLGELLTMFLGGKDGVVREDILEMFGVEGVEIILRYLTKYLQDLKVSDPLSYEKYKAALGDFGSDAIGSGFWQFLIGNLLVEPMAEELVFDNIENGTILKLYQAYELVVGGNVRGRDFSVKAREQMLSAAKETEEEDWWRVDRWDCWYKIEKAFGGMQWDQYTGRVDEYYRKLIDMNDASVKDIERIFARVYEIDASYGGKMAQVTSSLKSEVYAPLKNIAHSIVPSKG